MDLNLGREGQGFSTPNNCFNFFLLFPVQDQSASDGVLGTVLKQEMKKIYGDVTPEKLNGEYMSKYSSSLPHLLAGKFLS